MAIAMLWGWDGAGMLGFLYERGVLMRTERSTDPSSPRAIPEPPPRQVINLAGALIHSLHPLPTSPRPFNSESTQNPPAKQAINRYAIPTVQLATCLRRAVHGRREREHEV